jgi:CRP/FNR family transcriptional regulator, anaerobic regulatory protein
MSCASKVGREESGRAILLYEVGPGETCVLTTTCLMAGSSFSAESTAETDVLLGALPAVFHWLIKSSMQFVFGNYGELLSSSQSMRSCETF